MSTYFEKGRDFGDASIPRRADALLAAQPRPKESPFYREATFFLKLRGYLREIRSRKDPPEPPAFYRLLRHEWCEIIEGAGLDDDEALILREHLSGASTTSLGKLLGASRQAIHQRFQRAIEKIRVSYAVYPYAGLAEAYRSDIKRGRRNRASGTMQD